MIIPNDKHTVTIPVSDYIRLMRCADDAQLYETVIGELLKSMFKVQKYSIKSCFKTIEDCGIDFNCAFSDYGMDKPELKIIKLKWKDGVVPPKNETV